MSLGLFDVVGPIMHGPSSNHTAGANRIGYLAAEIMGGIPDTVKFGFHPIYFGSYVGQRSHTSLMAGCLGYREDDPRSVNALHEAAAKGIAMDCFPIREECFDRNTMRVVGKRGTEQWDINGISVGGGNIVVDRINNLDLKIDGNNWLLLMSADNEISLKAAVQWYSSHVEATVKSSACGLGLGGQWLYCGEFTLEPPVGLPEKLQASLAIYRVVPPLYTFRSSSNEKPLFATFKELLELCGNWSMIDIVLAYESQRSGRGPQEVLLEGQRLVDVIQEALDRGYRERISLIGGLTPEDEGKKMLAWAESGQTLTGGVFNRGLAQAVVLAQMNAAAGRIVAAPTGGSAGAMPGTLFTVAERLGKDKEELAKAFLIAAAIGMIIGNKASFSGTIGGCQAEVGIGAAMGAAGSVWMAGGSPEAIVHGACLALKNVLGLTCDPPASPVEVPCIKRNGMGVAVALMGAEMALAGLRSAIAPDDVVEALSETQRLLPTELKFSHCGGLATTKSGLALREQWKQKLQNMQ